MPQNSDLTVRATAAECVSGVPVPVVVAVTATWYVPGGVPPVIELADAHTDIPIATPNASNTAHNPAKKPRRRLKNGMKSNPRAPSTGIEAAAATWCGAVLAESIS